jgi:hypothetical protein
MLQTLQAENPWQSERANLLFRHLSKLHPRHGPNPLVNKDTVLDSKDSITRGIRMLSPMSAPRLLYRMEPSDTIRAFYDNATRYNARGSLIILCDFV